MYSGCLPSGRQVRRRLSIRFGQAREVGVDCGWDGKGRAVQARDSRAGGQSREKLKRRRGRVGEEGVDKKDGMDGERRGRTYVHVKYRAEAEQSREIERVAWERWAEGEVV